MHRRLTAAGNSDGPFPMPLLQGGSVMRTRTCECRLALLLALAGRNQASTSGGPPDWMKRTLPDQALKPSLGRTPGRAESAGSFGRENQATHCSRCGSTIPCAYCVLATTKAAKAAGATDAQIKEAIATAALVRFNSTMLNGSDGGVECNHKRK